MILDTNALSAFVDGSPAIGDVVRGQRRLALPVVVIGEFRYGIAISRHRAAYERWLDAHARDFEILDVTEATAAVYAALRVELKRRGRPIPANDAWIASLALEHGLPVLSRDAHFDLVAGLHRVDWSVSAG